MSTGKEIMMEVIYHAKSKGEKEFCIWLRNNLDRLLSKKT
jgi:hypothetical protein